MSTTQQQKEKDLDWFEQDLKRIKEEEEKMKKQFPWFTFIFCIACLLQAFQWWYKFEGYKYFEWLFR